MQARAKGLQTQVAEQMDQLSVLKRELTQKNQDMHELQLITAAWMGAGAGGGKAAGGSRAGGGALGTSVKASAGTGAGGAATAVEESVSAEVLQRVYRGCGAGVAPASVTLFFSNDAAAMAPPGSPPSYTDLMVTPYAGPEVADAGAGGELVCQTLAAQLGVGAEALVAVFFEEATDEAGQRLTAVALLVLASNHLLQAHGRYQVSLC